MKAATDKSKIRTRVSRGMTLLEVVVILAVLATLVALLVPSMVSYISTARVMRARADTRTIGNAIIAFNRDTGFFPKTSDTLNGRSGQKTIDLLVTPGSIPSSGATETQGWLSTTVDDMGNHLVGNVPGYTVRGPLDQIGWACPYLASPPESDPWGNRIMINVAQLDMSSGVTNAVGEVKRAVFILSAGPNGIVETPHEQFVTGASVHGDDVAFRLQ